MYKKLLIISVLSVSLFGGAQSAQAFCNCKCCKASDYTNCVWHAGTAEECDSDCKLNGLVAVPMKEGNACLPG